MEEMEVPLEQSQEHIQHHATHGGGGEAGGEKKWVLGVALSSAIFAALAAVASLQAGHHANEAIVAQIESSKQTIRASDTWTQYQAKSIKGAIAESRISLLKSLDKTPSAKTRPSWNTTGRTRKPLSTKRRNSSTRRTNSSRRASIIWTPTSRWRGR